MTTQFPKKVANFTILILFSINIFSFFNVGSAKGYSKSVYFIKTSYPMKNFETNGFVQKTRKIEGGYFVGIETKVDALSFRKFFTLDNKKIKLIKEKDKKNGEKVLSQIMKEKFLDQAIISLLKVINETHTYIEKDEEGKGVEEILNSYELSCLSFNKLTKFYLDILEIPSKIVIGIKFNPKENVMVLKGGALHSYLLIEIDNQEIFVDPLSFFGFVNQYYIFIDYYENFKKEDKFLLKDSTVELIENKDRIFYNPQIPQIVTFYKRSQNESSSESLILGKILKEKDLPCYGKVLIKAGGKETESDLFMGNFAFFIESLGTYFIYYISEKGEKKEIGEVDFLTPSIKKMVFYEK